MIRVLHVLDGDATRPAFDAAGITGDVVVWREACIEGPWPRALRGVDAVLARVRDAQARDEEVVLWFDTDLFCRLNAACLVAHAPGAGYTNALGNHTRREEMATLFAERAPLPGGYAEVWRAYTSADPRALVPLTHEHPWLKLHLGRFPSATNGLDMLEERLLTSVRDASPATPRELWMRVGEEPAFAPDRYGLTLEAVDEALRELAPLLGPEGLSALGRQVLVGERDRYEVAPLDRWVGGVYLEGRAPAWRWDGSALVRRT